MWGISSGMLEAKKIADLADLYYMPFAANEKKQATFFSKRNR